jgi:two-component system, NtrC family, response regulator AtoC
MKRIFCVEDDELYKRMLNHKLSLNPEFEVHTFLTGKELLERIDQDPDVVTLDLNLPDIDGIELMAQIRQQAPSTQVIVLSGESDIAIASKLFKLGAYDYIVKDENAMERIWNVVHKATSHAQLDKEVKLLREEVKDRYSFSTEAKGTSEEMQEVFELVQKTLRSNINVTISGETGTGKELIAKTIHYNSAQKNKPFVAINVAAIPDELIESELFGYEKGAFTGANIARTGQFEYVNGGTLFLDEIAEMSMAMQAKLLRVLQEMEIVRLGSNKRVPVNFRLITATHKDLLRAVEEGKFREDLYYRIIGIAIDLPPLRNRGKDVLLLANYFIEQFAKNNKMRPKKLALSAIKALTSYQFPGNIRELKAMMETAMAISDGELLTDEDLSMRPDIIKGIDYTDGKTLEEYTQQIIQNALINNKYNVVRTAKKLDVGKSTIYRLIQEGKIKSREK